MQGSVVQRVGRRDRQLQLGPLGGQRATQVVGDIGDEPALPFGGPLEPVEHPVHGRGQPTDLVVAAGRVDPTIEVAVGDEVDLGADPVEPPQRPADQHPGRRDEQRPDERYADQQGPPEVGRRLAHRLQAGADVDPDPVPGHSGLSTSTVGSARSRCRPARRSSSRRRPPVAGSSVSGPRTGGIDGGGHDATLVVDDLGHRVVRDAHQHLGQVSRPAEGEEVGHP